MYHFSNLPNLTCSVDIQASLHVNNVKHDSLLALFKPS